MNDMDQLRIQVLQVETRLGEMTIEVIRGRTAIAEKLDAMAVRVGRVESKVDTLTENVEHLAEEVVAIRGLIVELPTLLVQAIAEANRTPDSDDL